MSSKRVIIEPYESNISFLFKFLIVSIVFYYFAENDSSEKKKKKIKKQTFL